MLYYQLNTITMKPLTLLFALLFSVAAEAQQHTSVLNGTVYGAKPNTVGMMDASKVEAFMGTKPRISTTIKGRVIKVTKTKGGWFELDAGNGKVIAAHFKTYDVTISTGLAGHYVIAEGTMEKQFVADDMQHMAGDKQANAKDNPKQNYTFEVTGLMVDK